MDNNYYLVRFCNDDNPLELLSEQELKDAEEASMEFDGGIGIHVIKRLSATEAGEWFNKNKENETIRTS